MLKRTPLYEKHIKYNGKLVEFGGWELPVQYTGIIEEHENTRTHAGLFDVSHMGEFTVKGKDAERFLNKMVTSDISVMTDGQVKYSVLCYENGGTIDDLLVYRKTAQDYLLVVNASNIDKDREWIRSYLNGYEVDFADISDETGEVAIQGPDAIAITDELTVSGALEGLARYHFRDNVELCGVKCLISRTGYTGEDGYEIYCAADRIGEIWECLLTAGKKYGLTPVGLGARDTLRFEASMTLYGHELSSSISPIAAGLAKSVSFEKPEFIGRSALLEEKEKSPDRVRVGFEMIGKGIARNGYRVLAGDDEIGFVTSGSYAPTLKKNLGMAMVDGCFSSPGDEILIEVREKPILARVVPMPFYKRQK
jgi:aminomethyltransferase